MEWPPALGLDWLKKWNLQVDWRKGLLKFPKREQVPGNRSHGVKKGPHKEVAAALRSELLQGMPQEYHDLVEVFSEEGMDKLLTDPQTVH